MKQIEIVKKYMIDNGLESINQKEVLELFESGLITHKSSDPSATIRRMMNESSIETIGVKSYNQNNERYFFKPKKGHYTFLSKLDQEYINSNDDTSIDEKIEYAEYFLRRKKTNKKLRDYLLKELEDKCQLCGQMTFLKNNGDMYFEIHHIKPLSEDGEDEIDNLSKICANCHREVHLGENKNKLREKLLIENKKISQIKSRWNESDNNDC